MLKLNLRLGISIALFAKTTSGIKACGCGYGLALRAAKESKDRVRNAILNCRLKFPARRITLNLAPADLP